MVIAVLTVEYHLHGNDSLKGKRRVANSLKQKVRNTFNVAIAEYGTEDSLTRLRLMGHFPEQQRAAPPVADGQMPRHDGGRVFRRDGLQ